MPPIKILCCLSAFSPSSAIILRDSALVEAPSTSPPSLPEPSSLSSTPLGSEPSIVAVGAKVSFDYANNFLLSIDILATVSAWPFCVSARRDLDDSTTGYRWRSRSSAQSAMQASLDAAAFIRSRSRVSSCRCSEIRARSRRTGIGAPFGAESSNRFRASDLTLASVSRSTSGSTGRLSRAG